MVIILITARKLLLHTSSGHASSSIKKSIRVPKQNMRGQEKEKRREIGISFCWALFRVFFLFFFFSECTERHHKTSIQHIDSKAELLQQW